MVKEYFYENFFIKNFLYSLDWITCQMERVTSNIMIFLTFLTV